MNSSKKSQTKKSQATFFISGFYVQNHISLYFLLTSMLNLYVKVNQHFYLYTIVACVLLPKRL